VSLVTVTCMVCPATVRVRAPARGFIAAWLASRRRKWALAIFEGKYFVCCPSCYPRALDRSEGSVGRLKDEFRPKAVRA